MFVDITIFGRCVCYCRIDLILMAALGSLRYLHRSTKWFIIWCDVCCRWCNLNYAFRIYGLDVFGTIGFCDITNFFFKVRLLLLLIGWTLLRTNLCICFQVFWTLICTLHFLPKAADFLFQSVGGHTTICDREALLSLHITTFHVVIWLTWSTLSFFNFFLALYALNASVNFISSSSLATILAMAIIKQLWWKRQVV